MSVIRCQYCEKSIDSDFDVEHEDECRQANPTPHTSTDVEEILLKLSADSAGTLVLYQKGVITESRSDEVQKRLVQQATQAIADHLLSLPIMQVEEDMAPEEKLRVENIRFASAEVMGVKE